MSSKCVIVVRNENWLKREIKLVQHTDGHPNSMLLPLVTELREIYQELKEHGDPDWFQDPSKLAGLMITRSVPVVTDDMRGFLKTLPTAAKNRLESNFYLGMPALLPDVRVYDFNYEYIITLVDSVENMFLGYKLEVYKIQNNRRVSAVTTSEENLYRDTRILLPTLDGIEID